MSQSLQEYLASQEGKASLEDLTQWLQGYLNTVESIDIAGLSRQLIEAKQQGLINGSVYQALTKVLFSHGDKTQINHPVAQGDATIVPRERTQIAARAPSEEVKNKTSGADVSLVPGDPTQMAARADSQNADSPESLLAESPEGDKTVLSGDNTQIKPVASESRPPSSESSEDLTRLNTELQSSSAELTSLSAASKNQLDDATEVPSDLTQIERPAASRPEPNTLEDPTAFKTSQPSRKTDLTDKTVFKSDGHFNINREVGAGSVIKGRFVLEACIGHGGMGTVYKALDLRKKEMQDDQPHVAIKFLNDELRSMPEALVALQREAKKSQELAHPNIVTVYDFDRDGDLVYLSMEYLEGRTLDELIEKGYFKQLPVEKIMSLIERAARALAYSHQQGFVHADLKPSNIFLTNDGNIKVLDFGIAQAVRGTSENYEPTDPFDAYNLGAITPNFASLEMLEDIPPTPADDMYSLGCVAYILLTGAHPFLDEHGKKVNAKKAKLAGLEVAPIAPLSRRHMRAVRRCLEFVRQERFQDAGEFIDAIKAPAKIQRRVLGFLVFWVFVAGVSWWYIAKQSTVAVRLSDLPASMSELSDSITLGDQRFDSGDIDQAHKLYAQAWESSFDLQNLAPKDQFRLKVIVDRRMDKVASSLIKSSKEDDLDEFRLLQLQIALEFMRQDDVGTIDKKIDRALNDIQEKLDEL